MSVPFAEVIGKLHARLDHSSYYELLGVARWSDYVAVREAFHTRAQKFHPDRFVNVDNEVVRQGVYAVYKRMTEAYSVLGDPLLRRAYDDGLAYGQVRLSPEQRSRRPDADERQVSNVLARLYLRSARAKLAAGELDEAWIDCELGLSLEDVAPLRETQIQVVRRLAGR